MPPAIPIALLALAGFASGAGMRLLDPLLPGIAEEFGVTVGETATLVSAFMLPYALVQLAAGPLGDRFGKVRIASISLALFGASMLVATLSTSLPGLVALRALSGLCAGAVIPLMLAHLGDSVPYAERQVTLSRFLTGMVTAQLVAGPLSGMLADLAGWRASFAVLGVAALAIGGLLAARLGPALWQAARPAEGAALSGYLRMMRKPAARRLLAVAFFDGVLLFGGAFPFVASFLIEDLGSSAARAGLVVAAFGAGSFLYTRLARRLIDALGERGVLRTGALSLAALLGLLALAGHWLVVVPLQFGCGLAFYMFHGVLQARATEAMPEARGTAVSAFAMALFGGQAVGALLFGLIQGPLGYRAAFAVCAAGMLMLGWWAARPGPQGMARPSS